MKNLFNAVAKGLSLVSRTYNRTSFARFWTEENHSNRIVQLQSLDPADRERGAWVIMGRVHALHRKGYLSILQTADLLKSAIRYLPDEEAKQHAVFAAIDMIDSSHRENKVDAHRAASRVFDLMRQLPFALRDSRLTDHDNKLVHRWLNRSLNAASRSARTSVEIEEVEAIFRHHTADWKRRGDDDDRTIWSRPGF